MVNIKLKRGTQAQVDAYTPLEGELVYSTDTKKVVVGDGSTVGGKGVGNDVDNVTIGVNGSDQLEIKSSYTDSIEPVVSMIAGEDLTAGNIVYDILDKVYTYNTSTFNITSLTGQTGAANLNNGAKAIMLTDTLGVYHYDTGSYAMKVRAFTVDVSGNISALGSEVAVNTTTNNVLQRTGHQICKLTSTSFVISTCDSEAGTTPTILRRYTISGTTITADGTLSVNKSSGNFYGSFVQYISDDKVIWSRTNGSSAILETAIVNWSGSTPTEGTAISLGAIYTGSPGYYRSNVELFDTSSGVMFVAEAAIRYFTISSDVITLNTTRYSNSLFSETSASGAYSPSYKNVLFTYNSEKYIAVCMGKYNTTQANSFLGVAKWDGVSDWTKVAIYSDTTYSTGSALHSLHKTDVEGEFIMVLINDTSLMYVKKFSFNNRGLYTNTFSSAVSMGGNAIICPTYISALNVLISPTRTTANLVSIAINNSSNTTKFLGIVKDTVTSGNTANITTYYGKATLSGLEAGCEYHQNTSNVLTKSYSSTDVKVGMALSGTKLLIYRP